MIKAPPCFNRKCKHYSGVYQPDGTEMTEVNVCTAFPYGIPDIILSGKSKHLSPLPGQENTIVFEKEKE